MSQCLAGGRDVEGAFRELHRRHRALVWRICRPMLGTHEDAQDATQETFIRAFVSLGRYRGDAPFVGWLAQIARNTALNARRGPRASVALDDTVPDEAGTHSAVERSAHRQQVQDAIRMLPARAREFVVLRELEGLDYASIARRCNCSVGSVRSGLHDARRLLRRNLRLLLDPLDVPQERMIPMSDCVWARSRLEAFVARELVRKARERMEDHLAECTECAAALDAVKSGAPAPAAQVDREWRSVWDELTGLITRRAFAERLAEEVERARRLERTMGLVHFDIDFIARMNEEYGSVAVDRWLNDLGRVMKESVSAVEVPCRYGGDHFALLLPDTSADAPRLAAERIREAAEELRVPAASGEEASGTVSAGVALYPCHGATPDELMESAERALRQAKRDGGNRVVEAASW